MNAGTNLIIKMKQDMPGLISTMNLSSPPKGVNFFILFVYLGLENV